MFRWGDAVVYVLSCRLTSGPSWLGIYLFLWWFLLAIFGLFLWHWRYELPCQHKLPEFHYTPILGCIRVLWLVYHPLGLGLDKALFGWNSVNMGRTKVRKYLRTTDAQAVWKEYSEYMTTSSDGALEKRKLTHYVTNAVLDSQFREPLSNLSCTSMCNSRYWMNSLTYLRECQTPSR